MNPKIKYLVVALIVACTTTAQASQFFNFLKGKKRQQVEMVVQADTVVVEVVEPESEETIENPYSIYLNQALSPAEYDSLIAVWHQENVASDFDMFIKDFVNIEADSVSSLISEVSDEVIEQRLKKIISPIHIPYNDVIKRHIVSYTTRNKSTMETVISLSRYYFPIFEEALAREGMPLELRMLPVVESALRPTARSRMGATGLWQFMLATGRQFGLEVTSLTDQRCDPVLATDAACKYLKYLYGLYDDWTLAIAAYNCGQGNVNRALSRAGSGAKTYWDIYWYLPYETRNYVPAFIGATYAYTYYREHELDPSRANITLPIIATDTVMINKVTHFEQVSSTLNISMETLRSLNPMFTKDIVPAVEGKAYPLVIPASEITAYVAQEQTIMGKDSTYLGEYLNPSNLAKAASSSSGSRTYRIKSGDTLSGIARSHGTTATRIAQLNGMTTRTTLRIGRVLQIP